MVNEWLLRLATWLDGQQWSTDLHESYNMYNWVESTHVLTLMVFLGLLLAIDLRMLGLAFTGTPASQIADRLTPPMLAGFVVMVISGLVLFYSIPVRTTQSVWFRIKVVLLVAAGINALLFRNAMKRSVDSWDTDSLPPARIRWGAGISIGLWVGVVSTGRMIAYDWFDCHKEMPDFMYWAAGCVVELASIETAGAMEE